MAGWFWAKRQLNRLADADDLIGITTRINGGLNGLDDRRRLLTRAKSLMSLYSSLRQKSDIRYPLNPS